MFDSDDYEAYDECEVEDLAESHDYDSYAYDPDIKKNRRKHYTSPIKDIKKAYERYDDPIVQEALAAIADRVIKEADPRFNSNDFASWLKRYLDRRCDELGTKRIVVSGRVRAIVLRMLASDNEEFRQYAPIGKSAVDQPLWSTNPARFAWLDELLYGGAFSLAAKAAA